MDRDVVTPPTRAAMDDAARRRREWYAYYSEKRIGHQWMQARLLEGLDARTVLEVGPYLGLVTAMLDNAGYDVTTLDLFPPPFERPRRPHIEADLATCEAGSIAGFDVILCCETLEHLPWTDAAATLAKFHESGARYLVLSVPYEGFQLGWSFYLNPFAWRHAFALKKFRGRKVFRVHDDPWGHKWELGYRGYSVRRWERLVENAGWRIARREFTHPCRSVFHLCERGDGGLG